jgi:hypothetical protein
LAFPSRARPYVVSKNVSRFSAGRISTTACSSESPAFQTVWRVSDGTANRVPGVAVHSSPSIRTPRVPVRTSNRSSCSEWT